MDTLGFQDNGDFGTLKIAFGDLQHPFDASAKNNAYDSDGLRIFALDETISYAFDVRA